MPQKADQPLLQSIISLVPQADLYLVRGDSGRILMAHSAAKSCSFAAGPQPSSWSRSNFDLSQKATSQPDTTSTISPMIGSRLQQRRRRIGGCSFWECSKLRIDLHGGGHSCRARSTHSGTSSMWMRTGIRCARRTQVKIGFTLARPCPLGWAFATLMPRAMLSTWPRTICCSPSA